MRIDFFPLPLLIGLGVLVLLLPVIWLWKRSLRFLVVFSIFWIYMLMLTGLTLFPVHSPLTGEARRSVEEILGRVNLVPFHLGQGIRLSFTMRSEMFANLLLTVPFGVLIPALVRVRLVVFPLLAAGLGIGIELAQLGISLIYGATYRITDITDVILNFSGALAGYLVYLIISRLWQRKPEKLITNETK